MRDAIKSKEVMPVSEKKLSAASQAAMNGNYTRNNLEWLQREDDFILESVLADQPDIDATGDDDNAAGAPKSKKFKRARPHSFCINDFAVKFSKDPVIVALRILESDVPEMFGIVVDVGSEEACEFLGLVHAGVPLAMALRWCAATGEQLDRPLWSDVQATMTGPDRRKALHLVRETGMWFTCVSQLWALDVLSELDVFDVNAAVQCVLERVDAPTPDVVSQQMFGAFEDESAVDWSRMISSAGTCFVSDLMAKPEGEWTAGGGPKGNGRSTGRGRSAAMAAASTALPGSAEYSANPSNWGGVKKSYRKRRTFGTRTIKAGTSYASVKGKAVAKKRFEGA